MEQVGGAGAVAEPAVVEHQREAAMAGEALGERGQPVAPRPGQSVRHHHDRAALLRPSALGLVDPSGARIAGYVELHVASTHALMLATHGRHSQRLSAMAVRTRSKRRRG